jgi:hypothetical protein
MSCRRRHDDDLESRLEFVTDPDAEPIDVRRLDAAVARLLLDLVEKDEREKQLKAG